MKRRGALKHIGAGISAGLILPWLSSCKEDDPKPGSHYKAKVGIIGAGAAGLFAGDYLLENGFDVELYEASPRIGGRVRTLRSFDAPTSALWFNQQTKLSSDFPVELGADRFRGPMEANGQDSIWYKFVRNQLYNDFPLTDRTDYYWMNGGISDFATANTDSDFAGARSFLQNLRSNAVTAGTVQQAVESAGIAAQTFKILNGWIGNSYGTTNTRLGIPGIVDREGLRERCGEYMLQHNPMADVLIGSFIRASEKTLLNTVVKEVDYRGEKVVITGEHIINGSSTPFTSTVDKLLITVPVSVLKSGDITFTPALPEAKTAALSKIGMDAAIRVVLDFRKKFWADDCRYIYGGEKGIEYFVHSAGRSDVAKSMSVTISGEKAEELSPLGLDIIPELLAELDSMFNNQASENIRRDATNDEYIAAVQDWSKESYIKGSASYLKPNGSNKDRETLGQPVDGILFFAGEATDNSGEAGTVNGALLSAERAAKQIIAKFA